MGERSKEQTTEPAPKRRRWPGARLRRALRWTLFGGAALGAAALLLVGGYLAWLYSRSQPEPVARQLFAGVSYQRLVRTTPRPLVIHQVIARVGTPGLRFLVTPPEPVEGRALRAATTGEFLAEQGLQLAVNGAFFIPWYSRSPLHYYPKSGDPVDALGFSAGRGEVYGLWRKGRAVFYVSCHQRPTFTKPKEICQAISGRWLLWQGEPYERVVKGRGVNPRTAIGLDRDERRLILIVVDGRQPGYSEGVHLRELAGLLREAGAHTAMSLDGGGSTTLVMEGKDGQPRLLNTPMHSRIAGRQRPVANHLGLYAAPLPDAESSATAQK